MSRLCILEISPLSAILFAVVFSYSQGCLLILFIVSFAVRKCLINEVPFIYFLLLFPLLHYSRRWVTEDLAVMRVKEWTAYVFLS